MGIAAILIQKLDSIIHKPYTMNSIEIQLQPGRDDFMYPPVIHLFIWKNSFISICSPYGPYPREADSRRRVSWFITNLLHFERPNAFKNALTQWSSLTKLYDTQTGDLKLTMKESSSFFPTLAFVIVGFGVIWTSAESNLCLSRV